MWGREDQFAGPQARELSQRQFELRGICEAVAFGYGTVIERPGLHAPGPAEFDVRIHHTPVPSARAMPGLTEHVPVPEAQPACAAV